MTAPPARPRVAILSWSDARFDGRTERVARSALDAGYDVVVYARWNRGLPLDEERDGYRVVRVPFTVFDALRPGRQARRRGPNAEGRDPQGGRGTRPRARGAVRRALGLIGRLPGMGWASTAVDLILQFPVRPLAWANALDHVVEPATIWHGMWAGSLPALDRLRRHHGGATIYDSRDVFLLSRKYGLLPGWLVAPFRTLERRWARRADAVVTVNDAYARLLQETLGVRVDAVVRNTPPRQAPPVARRPNLIRERCGLGPSIRVVLYQGQLVDGRGIEEGMAAILDVPDAVLALLGFGRLRDVYAATAARPPYRDRVVVLDAVPPSELLEWTRSADVALMAIQPTTLNHRFTTPNKIWEALAVGTPIVASDLPGMADVIRETGAGVLCDPTSPASIASAIRSILDLAPADRDAMRDRAAAAARDRYNWETQAAPLLALYAKLAEGATASP